MNKWQAGNYMGGGLSKSQYQAKSLLGKVNEKLAQRQVVQRPQVTKPLAKAQVSYTPSQSSLSAGFSRPASGEVFKGGLGYSVAPQKQASFLGQPEQPKVEEQKPLVDRLKQWGQEKFIPSMEKFDKSTPQEKLSTLGDIAKKVPGAVKSLVTSDYGYGEEEVKKAKPSLKETMSALSKYPAQVAYGLLDFGSNLLFGEQTDKEGRPISGADVFGADVKPSTPGEAKVMQGADIAQLGFGVGEARDLTKLFSKVAATEDLGLIAKEYEKAGIKLSDDALYKMANATTPHEVSDITNEFLRTQDKKLSNIKSAAVKVGGTVYEGASHAEAIKKAQQAGEDISMADREAKGLFKTKDGRLITREQANKEFGITHSEEVPHLKAQQESQPFKSKRIIPENLSMSEKGAEIYQELDNAKAGTRTLLKSEGDVKGIVAEKSTFPKWIPEDLRTSKNVEEVKQAMLDNTLPKSKPAQRLYDIVHNKLREGEGLPKYDFEKYDRIKTFETPKTKEEGLLVKARREQRALESSKKALELEKPTQKVSEKISKDPQLFHKDISYLEGISKTKKSQAFINTKNLDISSEGRKFVEKTIEEAKPMFEESVGKTLTNKEVIDLADRTSQTLNRTIGREQTKNFEAALLNTRRKLATMAESGTVDKEYIETLKTVKTLSTDIGRKLQSFSVKAGTTDLSKQKMIEAVLKVNDNVDEILKAAKDVDFTNANQATEFYRKFIKPTTGEWLDLLRYNSMLSSPTTHIINTFSNAINTAIVAPIEKTLTGTLDFIGGVFGKQRQAFAGEGGAYLKGYIKNLGDATKRFADVLTGKRAMTNLDLRFVPVATKGVKGAVEKTLSVPTRLLEASDQFFTAIAEAGEKSALELRQAKGVKVPLLQLKAQEKAAYRVFRQDLFDKDQGHLLDAIDQFTSKIMSLRNNKNPLVSTVSKFTVPFVKTPMNIFKQGLEYSPAGFATAFGSKNKMEQISKAIIGSTVFAGAATMLASGRLTWGEPTGAKQKQEFRQAGMQPYSVKIGNKWYSYQKLVPAVAFPMAMVAAIDDLQKSKKMDDTTTEMVLGGIAKYGQFLADQSFVKTIGDTLSAAKGGEAGIANVVSNYPQQLIPFRALGGWLAKLTDDVQRQVDNKAGFIDKQMQLLMMNIPWASTKVPARLDITGKPITSDEHVLNSFSPVKISTEKPAFKKVFEEAAIKRKEAAEHQAMLEKAKKKTLETGEYQKVDDTFTYLDKSTNQVKTSTSEAMVKGRPIYDNIHSIEDEGKRIEALNNLSDQDYELYKKVSTAEKTKVTNEFKDKLKTEPKEAVSYLRSLPQADKDRILKNMTDEEYAIYEQGK